MSGGREAETGPLAEFPPAPAPSEREPVAAGRVRGDSPVVTVVDHGAGNLASVVRALGREGAAARLSRDPEEVAAATRLVLPGDGHFGEAMRGLRRRNLEAPLSRAIERGASLLGICVGLQMLFPESEEAPEVPGLGLLPGRVRRFGPGLVVPHIGWNQLEAIAPGLLFEGIPEGGYAYFLHSFFVAPARTRDWLTRTDYGIPFASAAGAGRIAGIQFHPEKSGRLGARVLRNYLSWAGGNGR